MTDNLDERLAEISAKIEGGGVETASVRELLSWVGAKRRGSWISWRIRQALSKAELLTHPDFEEVWIDELVHFLRVSKAHPAVEGTTPSSVAEEDSPAVTPDQLIDSLQSASYRISRLKAASNIPTSVAPDASLREAVTIMMTRDFSQLPVMTGERDVKGVISWRSIAQRTALGASGAKVREFMDEPVEARSNASVFKIMSLLREHEYVLVRGDDQKIKGLVTASDLTIQFRQWTEPFLLISEIEHALRQLIDSKFTAQELEAVRNPQDEKRTVHSAADMAFGEYIRLLERDDNWSKLNLPLDRKTFIQILHDVRRTRNDVMHFDPDGIDDDSRDQLRSAVSFLERLREIGRLR